MEYFAADVLDELAPTSSIPAEWLDAGGRVLKQDAVLSSMRVRTNLAFHEAWRAAIGTAPTRVDVLDYASRQGPDAFVRCMSECTSIVLFSDAQARVQRAVAEFARCNALFETDHRAARIALLTKLADRHCAPGTDVAARVSDLANVNLVAAYAQLCCKGGGLEAYEAWVSGGGSGGPHPETPAEAYSRAGKACAALRLLSRCPVTGHTIPLPAVAAGRITCNEALRASIMRDRFMWRTDSGGACIVGPHAKTVAPAGPFPFRVASIPAACLLHAVHSGKQRLYATVISAGGDTAARHVPVQGVNVLTVRSGSCGPPASETAAATETIVAGGPVPRASRWSAAPNEYWIPDVRTWSPAAPSWSDALTRIMWAARMGPPNPGLLAYHQFVARYAAIRGLNTRRFNTRMYICPRGRDGAASPLGEVVLIDTRANVLSVLSLLVTLDNLREDAWKVTVFCSHINRRFMERCVLPHVPNARIEVLPVMGDLDGSDGCGGAAKFDIETYNRMFKSESFWERFSDSKRVLFVQDDGLLMRPGLEDDTDIMRQSYVGAPWLPGTNSELDGIVAAANHVGNGGMSLRDPVVMANICRESSIEAADGSLGTMRLFNQRVQPEPEDVFFSGAIARGAAQPCPFDVATRFSFEPIPPSPDALRQPLGMHKPWPYIPFDTFQCVLQRALIDAETRCEKNARAVYMCA